MLQVLLQLQNVVHSLLVLYVKVAQVRPYAAAASVNMLHGLALFGMTLAHVMSLSECRDRLAAEHNCVGDTGFFSCQAMRPTCRLRLAILPSRVLGEW